MADYQAKSVQHNSEPIAVPFKLAPQITGHSLTRLRQAAHEGRLIVKVVGKSHIVEMSELRRYVRSLPYKGREPDKTISTT